MPPSHRASARCPRMMHTRIGLVLWAGVAGCVSTQTISENPRFYVSIEGGGQNKQESCLLTKNEFVLGTYASCEVRRWEQEDQHGTETHPTPLLSAEQTGPRPLGHSSIS